MKLRLVSVTGALLTAWAACAQSQSPAVRPTAAEIAIRQAQDAIARQPEHFSYYNALAAAYVRRAGETSDVTFYANAEGTLNKSFQLSPDNFDGMKVKAGILLGRHEYEQALDLANRLNKQSPDDITVYSYLADANTALGNYKEAVAAVQWMLNIRPGNPPGLAHAGLLREVHGDFSGAIDVLQMAFDSISFQETDSRARLLTQISSLYCLTGEWQKADEYANSALGILPAYPEALATLAKVREAQKRYGDAVTLFEKRYAATHRPGDLFDLADALSSAGRPTDAHAAFADFERQALQQSAKADNANLELVAYYTDVTKEPAKALPIARREAARRHDVYTLAAYAWSMAANGDYSAAHAEMTKALAVGVKDPQILAHARDIDSHLTQVAAAGK
jgi:tetratricopeptide (TPR) repeat protein